jgi:hypothetical protein
MKKSIAILILATSSAFAVAAERRDEAVKKSPVIAAVLEGLSQEQGLKCSLAIDEDGSETIQYVIENNRKKFIAVYLCRGGDGRSAVFKGIIGDGGQTAVEKFELIFAN